MKEINLEELKKNQLEILSEVHSFCENNQIHYSLCGGSLIGAVRHKGYIPWDDDIDIMMPRPDYEKFRNLFNKDNNSGLKFIDCFNDIQYFQPFGKVINTKTKLIESYDRPVDAMGINIDIFPIDGLPSRGKEREKFWKKILRLRNINSIIYQKENPNVKGIKKIARDILYYIFKFLPANYYAKKINFLAMKIPFDKSDTVADTVFGYGKKEENPYSNFDSYVELPFEGFSFKVCVGYKIYLENIFGNYMQFPPVEQQVAKHKFSCYWR